MPQPIRSALVSVYYKDRLEPLVALLKAHGVTLYSTGGTQQFLEEQGAEVTAVETLTGFPEVFGGRVKTLHPKVFGGILQRRHEAGDQQQAAQHQIPPIDLVIVDLYPFEETVAAGAAEADVIEKIDIGGIALLRAAAKNCRDVLVVSSRDQYAAVTALLQAKSCATDPEDRRAYAAAAAFQRTAHYDAQIAAYLGSIKNEKLKIKSPEESTSSTEQSIINTSEISTSAHQPISTSTPLRYGENPHQAGTFHGDLGALFDQLHGKQLSYNNLVDVDAAVLLMREFEDGPPTCAILKHTNACGRGAGRHAARCLLTCACLRPGIGVWRRYYYESAGGRGYGPGAEQAVLRGADCAGVRGGGPADSAEQKEPHPAAPEAGGVSREAGENPT